MRSHFFSSNAAYVFFTAAMCIVFHVCIPQVQPDAGSWKTFVLNSTNQVKIKAPAKETLTKEMAELKSMALQRDEKIKQQVYYWDAGAPAYRWNQIALALASSGLGTPPDWEKILTSDLKLMPWMHVAIYDATVAAWKAKYLYKRKRPSLNDPSLKALIKTADVPSYPCEHSVTAGAAAAILAYYFPEKADSIFQLAEEAGKSRMYAGVQYPSDVKEGLQLGKEVASLVIERIKNSGYDNKWSGMRPNDLKLWRGDAPAGLTATNYKTIVLKEGKQFRPPPPPDFASDMADLKNMKQNLLTGYTAYFWAVHGPFHAWPEIAHQKIFEYRLDENAPKAAEIYAVLHVALHDAFIACWDAKYAYWGTRPDQYDTTYRPLLRTPPFPGYPSGHSTMAGAAATVLQHFFPGDAMLFKEKTQEVSNARLWAGAHFLTDNTVGLDLGSKVASYVLENWSTKK